MSILPSEIGGYYKNVSHGFSVSILLSISDMAIITLF